MLIVVALIVLGLCLGSFVNALVWRLHEQEEYKTKKGKKNQALLRALSISRGRSMCSYCHHALAPQDLIPVLSWVWLRGRCRYCHHKIEDNPVAELATPALFIISYLCWPTALQGLGLMQFCFWLVFVVGFVALMLYDIRWYLLPDRIVFPLIILAILELTLRTSFFAGGLHALISSAWGVFVGAGFFYAIFQVSKGAWIGGGDVKLGLLLGILLGGPQYSFLLLFLSSAFGSLISMPLLLVGKVNRRTLVPYGPFLLGAAFIVVVFGDRIIHWFNGLILG